MKICASCGASLPDGAAFCIGCGSKEFQSAYMPDLNAPEPEKPKIEYDQYGRPIGQEYKQQQYEQPHFSEDYEDPYNGSGYSDQIDHPQYLEGYNQPQYSQPQGYGQYVEGYQPQQYNNQQYNGQYDQQYDNQQYGGQYDQQYDDQQYDGQYDQQYDDQQYDGQYDQQYDDQQYDGQYDQQYDDQQYDGQYDQQYDSQGYAQDQYNEPEYEQEQYEQPAYAQPQQAQYEQPQYQQPSEPVQPAPKLEKEQPAEKAEEETDPYKMGQNKIDPHEAAKNFKFEKKKEDETAAEEPVPTEPKNLKEYIAYFQNTDDHTHEYDPYSFSSKKNICKIAVLGFTFWVPFVAAKDCASARFYANQGLLVFILELICLIPELIFTGIVGIGFSYGVLAIIGIVIDLILTVIIYSVPLFMIITSFKNIDAGKIKDVPFIGKFRIIK